MSSLKKGLLGIAVLIGALVVVSLTPFTSTAQAGTSYTIQAFPNAFGPWTQVAAHAGAVNYTISATPLGSTTIVGEVKYFKNANQPAVVVPFYGSISFRTCRCYGTVEVRFKGIPLGSAVRVTVN